MGRTGVNQTTVLGAVIGVLLVAIGLVTIGVEPTVFGVAGAIVLGGAVGVVISSNPVHAALSLVATLFGVAVLFVAQQANFLAAVQVIVYAGAIVVLFLFVIMLLGVDSSDDLETDPLVGQRPVALVLGALLALGLVAVVVTSTITGAPAASARWDRGEDDISQIGRLLFSEQLFAFEITSLLLVIAVVGAVVLARTTKGAQLDADEPVASLPGDPVLDEERDDEEATP
ncbi:NADH-quinone oxidoreductase subunit J [Iamia sp. SCSIO 61187]|uniref:NADH-quinone oxidoreductase subunit J family protein n=1 Tax=Iamia sp. SCSIO 61187 TaxID=2722752 RepID=UPI001C626931|nr:NADH-quinone oxidoreductase subunit J [Iamia sp. SCSIO 61187]QYG94809.1 NADH-quinone oxidoreductase subunit J [Iamia sp. SCSIO 61187]